jgi:diguanylate cyclase (GGDEF)-like protein
MDSWQTLVGLSYELQLPVTLEELLDRVVNRAAELLHARNASIRLLDASRSKLLVGCRAGTSFHGDPSFEFKLGEGLVGWVAQRGRTLRLGHAADDPRFVTREDMRQRIGSFLGVPLVHKGLTIGVLSVAVPELEAFSAQDEQAAQILAAMCAPHLEVARLARLAWVDPVTGSLNKRALDETFPDLGESELVDLLSVFLVDIDGFKTLNARHGRAVGDEILRAVARVLAGSLRVGDAVIRYGGDEFLLVVPGVALTSASRVAERARAAVDGATIEVAGEIFRATVSIGVAQRRSDEARPSLIARAQAALTAAKQHGANCVRLAID